MTQSEDRVRIEFARSAFRHGVSEERIRHVVEQCPQPLYLLPPDAADGATDLVAFLGPDPNGVPLEVIAVELPEEALHVIHAMRMRRRYAADYGRVNG